MSNRQTLSQEEAERLLRMIKLIQKIQSDTRIKFQSQKIIIGLAYA